MEEINNVSNNCTTCKHFKKMPPRPIVYLPMAPEFWFISNKSPDTILTQAKTT